MKNKKWLSLLGSISLIGTSITVVSCGSSVGISDKLKAQNVAKGKITIRSNSKLDATPFAFARNTIYGSSQEGLMQGVFNANSAQFVRTSSVGESKAIEIKGSDPAKYKYIAWSHESNKFDLADAIIITAKDGTITIFDSDVAEIQKDGKDDNPVSIATSKDPKSINSQAFRDALAGAKRMQIRIKGGVNYVNSKGKKTKYQVKAEDFWASYQHTYLRTTNNRIKEGGTEALDTKILETSPSGNLFSKKGAYQNDYLYGLFNVNVQKFLAEDTGLLDDPNKSGTKLLTWDVFEQNGEPMEGSFAPFFDKLIRNTTEFTPVSIDYVKDLNKKDEYKDFVGQSDSIVKKVGIYTYGKKWEDMLYAGYLYISDVSIIEKTVKYLFNDFYVHADKIKKNKGYIKEVTILYDNDSSIVDFDSNLVSQFKLGELFSLETFGSLTKTQKQEIIDFQKANKVEDRYEIKTFRTSITQAGYVLTHPVPRKDDEGKLNPTKYTFNDNYAKIVYGMTLEELNEGSKVSEFFTPRSIAFRNNIMAAINWQQAVRTADDGLEPYFGHLPPNANLGGKDAETADFNSLGGSSELDKLNTLRVIQYDKAKETLTYLEKTSNKADNEKIIIDNPSKASEQYKSNVYQEVKAEIKKILDEANIPVDQKVKWDFIRYKREKFSAAAQTAVDALVKVWNSLDPRIEIGFKVIENETEYNAVARKGFSTMVHGGWSYDYNGAGTGLDGLTHRAKSIILPLYGVAIDDANNGWIKKLYPNFYKTAKAFDKFIKELNKDITAPATNSLLIDKTKPILDLSNWDELANKVWAISDETEKSINVKQFGLMGAFWANYQTKLTNAEILDVIIEHKELIGFIPGLKEGFAALPKAKPIRQIVHGSRSRPTSTDGTLFLQDLILKK